MKITVRLYYNANAIDGQYYVTRRRQHGGIILDIDITRLIDSRVNDAIRRTIEEPPHPSNVDSPPTED